MSHTFRAVGFHSVYQTTLKGQKENQSLEDKITPLCETLFYNSALLHSATRLQLRRRETPGCAALLRLHQQLCRGRGAPPPQHRRPRRGHRGAEGAAPAGSASLPRRGCGTAPPAGHAPSPGEPLSALPPPPRVSAALAQTREPPRPGTGAHRAQLRRDGARREEAPRSPSTGSEVMGLLCRAPDREGTAKRPPHHIKTHPPPVPTPLTSARRRPRRSFSAPRPQTQTTPLIAVPASPLRLRAGAAAAAPSWRPTGDVVCSSELDTL